jgi:rod shape-determining protein MreD
MKKMVVLILCAGALTLQIFVKPHPDLLLLLLPILSLYIINKGNFLVICWALGLLRDIFSDSPFGLGCLLFVISGYCFINIGRLFDFRNIFAISTAFFFLVLLFYICEGVLCAIDTCSLSEIFSRGMHVAIFTTALLIIIIVCKNIASRLKYMLSKDED